MQIKLIDFTEELKSYMEQYTEEAAEELWDQIVLGEKWTELCVYSPVDLDNRKPKAIHDIETLKAQTDLLAKIDHTRLQQFFDKVASVLPNYDDDPITAALIPSDPANRTVNELQNGVLGTSLFGNILIQVNPMIEGFES